MWNQEMKVGPYESSVEWWYYALGLAVLLAALLLFCQAIPHLTGAALAQEAVHSAPIG